MLQLLSYHLNIQRSVRFLLLQELIFQTLGSFLKVGLMKARIQKRHFLGELEEEIGTKDIEIIAEYPTWVSYLFPPVIAQKMYPYDGQKQNTI